MRSPWTFALFAWVLSLLHYVEASSYEHALEKIYLWEMYNIFCDIETPATQGYIFPFDKGNWANFANKGSMRDERMTYAEFMHRLNRGRLDLTNPDLVASVRRDLLDPGVVGYQTAARDLESKGFTKTLVIENINRDYINISEGDSRYRTFMDQVDAQLAKFRKEGNQKYITPSRLRNLRLITNDIINLRKEESQGWMVKHLENDLKLNLDPPRSNMIPSSVSGQPNYRKVDVLVVFLDYNDDEGEILKKNFGSVKEFVTWADAQTNIVDDPSNRNLDDSKSHLRTIATWTSINNRLSMPDTVPESCDS